MFKSPGISRKQTGVIVTLLVLLFLGASYFYIYLPNNEKTVQERRFRCLQNIDNNIHTKINTSFLMVNNLLSAYTLSTQAKQNSESLSHFIGVYNSSIDNYHYSKVDFTILESATPVLDNDSLTFLAAQAKDMGAGKGKSVNIYIQFGAAQFIKPLLPSGVFDNYIVFYRNDNSDIKKSNNTNKNTKLYESFPSGLKGNPDSLLDVKSKIVSPGIRSLSIGGTDYKVFSQPVSTGHGDNWIIAGLVSDKNYQSEKSQLPLWIILLLLTAAIGIIVSIPWIKLYHMGNKDKLTVRDGIATILVAMMLMSLLFFVLFKYNVSSLHFIKDHHLPSSKDTLADKIRNAFESEIDANYQLLDTCDKVHARGIKIDIWNFGNGSQQDYLLKKIGQPLAVNQVYWLDTKTGKEKTNWVVQVQIPKGSDLHERDYFKNTLQNRPNRKGKFSYFLDQNFSRVTGGFVSVIAKKSAAPDEVAAIGFTARSLDSVVMPDGYQFAIIDANGNVLYHYHPELNLNENLKIEFADSSNLVSSLEAKSDTDFEAEYFGKRYNVKIKPFPDLPYYTVILEDQEYNDTRDMEAYVFTLSMLILLLLFLIVEFSLVFFTSSRRSFFKKQIFDTSWVGPKITSHGQYNMAIVANIVIIVLLTLYFEPNSFLIYLYILLFSIVFVSIFLNGIFAQSYKESNPYLYHFKKVAIRALCVFAIIIDFAACKTLKSDPQSDHIFELFRYEFILIVICGIIYFSGPYLLKKIRLYKEYSPFKWTYTHSFAMMATTRLIITCGIPVAFFFIYSYNYEQKLDTRYRQLKFAKQFAKKIKLAGADNNKIGEKRYEADRAKIDSLEDGRLYTTGVYYDGLYIDSIKITNKSKKVTAYTGEDFITAGILSAFRFHIYDVEVKNNNMNLPDIADSTTFSKIEHDKDILLGKVHKPGHRHFARTTLKLDDDEYLKVSSNDISYPKPDFYFWIWLALGISLFYIIIHKIIKKLFALDLPSTDKWKKMDDHLLTNNKLNSLLLIIGPPGSGKLRRLKKKLSKNKLSESDKNTLLKLESNGTLDQLKKKLNEFKEKRLLGNHDEILVYYDEDEYPGEKEKAQNNVFVADMIKIPAGPEQDDAEWKHLKKDALSDSNSLVILNHFEYNIKDPKTNSLKLDFLESLMLKGRAKIIIISTVHPLTFLNSFNEQQTELKTGDKKTTDAAPEVANVIDESELERWHVVLGHYRIVIEPMEWNDPEDADILKHAIKQETEYSHFLGNMREATLAGIATTENFEEIGAVSDSLIFKVQIVSHYFYTYIWQSLTKEEKFLLYDLAEDGLVNPYDDYNLVVLISKGLIIKNNGTLMLFNKGFRNFILTAIGETEVNRIKEQVKDNGNWNSLKIPLNITILAILIFLFTSQQEAYSRIITYITAFSAGIPAVMKVFSLFGNSTQKTQ